ncbi:MAG: zinc ribbon domain-containing protein [Planctomycetota bacterium]|jgi:putative FmdB family regulatory protein|nr:zinc ribbon domain-containing protein [Planctomycetota bacterium]HBO51780.1 FmdB family transcriptional regulator [Planctomycetota bacterium]|tara:strand:+ start:378 stop:692 length:315 start_codon:yes stop_codon:yes gene_type:complete
MPTYEYRCQECEEICEFLQSFSDSPKRKCPSCGRHRLKKMISGGAGLIFKGSGFYITDYRKADYEKDAKADKDSDKSTSADSGKDSSKKSKDAKPASKDSAGEK